MFGFSFKDKVKKVLEKHFNYRPNFVQKPMLSAIASQAKSQGANEYDAAIMFMMTQMGALIDGDPRIEPFIRKHLRNIDKIIHLAASPSPDIRRMMDEILKQHGLNSSTVQDEHEGFKVWLKAFKARCATINQQLSINTDGSSMIDFMDQEPLVHAYEDGVPPEKLADQFAPTYDVNTFGMNS